MEQPGFQKTKGSRKRKETFKTAGAGTDHLAGWLDGYVVLGRCRCRRCRRKREVLDAGCRADSTGLAEGLACLEAACCRSRIPVWVVLWSAVLWYIGDFQYSADQPRPTPTDPALSQSHPSAEAAMQEGCREGGRADWGLARLATRWLGGLLAHSMMRMMLLT